MYICQNGRDKELKSENIGIGIKITNGKLNRVILDRDKKLIFLISDTKKNKYGNYVALTTNG